MNEEELIKQLQQVDLSDITLPGHQRRLAKALLNSRRFRISTPMSMFIKKASPIGGVIAAVVVAVVVFTFVSAPTGSAQQLAQRSYKAFASLPPARQAALKAQLGLNGPSGLDEILRQAQNAKDLCVLTYDQLTNRLPAGITWSASPDGQAASTTYLMFTGQNDVTYAIGVNNDSSLPTVALAYGGSGKAVIAVHNGGLPGPVPQGQAQEVNVSISTSKQGAILHVNGRKIPLPPGIDPANAKVLMKDGKIYVNDQEVQP
jgi:hypothetical protein